MERLGGSDDDGDNDRPEDRIVKAGVRAGELLKQIIAAVVILIVFVGLLYLRLVDQIGDDAIILYAGVILGYLLHSIKEFI